MAKFSKLEKVFIGIVIFCVIMLVYLLSCALVFFRKKTIPIVINTSQDYVEALSNLSQVQHPLTNNEYRETLKKQLPVGLYIYLEKDLGDTNSGLTLATIRTIVLDDSLVGHEYCVTLTHELMHLKYFIQDERYVCWQTFLFLWQCEELNDVAQWYSYMQIYGYYNGDYDISDLVVDYLTNK